MIVTKIAHASILIEADGKRIISDPWWRGPCFGAQWWVHPEPFLAPLATEKIDYIYLSHGHHDHFHPGTLLLFPKDTPVLVSKRIDLADAVRELGFPVIALDDDEELALSEKLKCRIIRTHNDDTLMALSDGTEVCINLNDALHSAPAEVQDTFIALLKAWYPRPDYVYCGYGMASHFPICYSIPGKDDAATAIRRQAYLNGQWVRIIRGLSPKFGFPFAADVVFFEKELFWANEPIHNGERPTDAFTRACPDSDTQVLDIAPGFAVAEGKVISRRLRERLSCAGLEASATSEISQANVVRPVSEESLDDLLGLLRKNMDICRPYLREFRGNYIAYVRVKGAGSALRIDKRGDVLEVSKDLPPQAGDAYDAMFTSRLPYLKRSLSTPYGSEILFVGSGGRFDLPGREAMARGVHLELKVLLSFQARAPESRFGKSGRMTFLAKRFVKRVLGWRESNLYDLAEWTVFRP